MPQSGRPGKLAEGEELRAACEGVQQGDASPLPMDTSEQVRLWAEDLTNADIDGTRRILRTIAAVVPGHAQRGLAVDRADRGCRGYRSGPTATIDGVEAMAWPIRMPRENWPGASPPTEAVDTSEPDVVSLATLLADPPDPSAHGWRAGLTFGGTDGIYSRTE